VGAHSQLKMLAVGMWALNGEITVLLRKLNLENKL